jgi:hypothetical protein
MEEIGNNYINAKMKNETTGEEFFVKIPFKDIVADYIIDNRIKEIIKDSVKENIEESIEDMIGDRFKFTTKIAKLRDEIFAYKDYNDIFNKGNMTRNYFDMRYIIILLTYKAFKQFNHDEYNVLWSLIKFTIEYDEFLKLENKKGLLKIVEKYKID